MGVVRVVTNFAFINVKAFMVRPKIWSVCLSYESKFKGFIKLIVALAKLEDNKHG